MTLRPFFRAAARLEYDEAAGWYEAQRAIRPGHPARPIFRLALGKLGVEAADCLFVGDRPKWDIDGPKAVGMAAVLIDREGAYPGCRSIKQLRELLPMVELPG